MELFQYTRNRNTIVYLDTGSGKTLVALLLLLDKKPELKRLHTVAVFLAPTIPLVMQQGSVLKKMGLGVQTYTGNGRFNQWAACDWQEAKKKHDVLAMTPEVLIHTLAHGYLSLKEDIGLVIFDEVHHGTKDHPYATLMKDFYPVHSAATAPQVLGLTASPHKPSSLQDTFFCQLVTAASRWVPCTVH